MSLLLSVWVNTPSPDWSHWCKVLCIVTQGFESGVWEPTGWACLWVWCLRAHWVSLPLSLVFESPQGELAFESGVWEPTGWACLWVWCLRAHWVSLPLSLVFESPLGELAFAVFHHLDGPLVDDRLLVVVIPGWTLWGLPSMCSCNSDNAECGSHFSACHLTSVLTFRNSVSTKCVWIIADRWCIWGDNDLWLLTEVRSRSQL